jgi:hypothetical protein
MKSARKEMQELIREYSRIKDELLDYTEAHHDGMLFDIEGYCEQIAEGEYDDLEALKQQLGAVRMLLEAHKNLNYIFC